MSSCQAVPLPHRLSQVVADQAVGLAFKNRRDRKVGGWQCCCHATALRL